MKKLLFILMIACGFVFCSCKSDVEKANELIDKEMFYCLYHYDSYQVISTDVRKEKLSIRTDTISMKLIDEIYNQNRYDLVNELVDRVSYLEKSNKYVYVVYHRYRCRAQDGSGQLPEDRFYIDSKMKNILYWASLDVDNYRINKLNYLYNEIVKNQ